MSVALLTGKRVRLNSGTLAVEHTATGHPGAVTTIHSGEVVEIVSDTDRHGMLDVLCNGHVLTMFEVDLEARGEELGESSGEHDQRLPV